MLPQEVIRAKRDGRALSSGEVKDFITGLTNGSVSEGQVAAFAMCYPTFGTIQYPVIPIFYCSCFHIACIAAGIWLG